MDDNGRHHCCTRNVIAKFWSVTRKGKGNRVTSCGTVHAPPPFGKMMAAYVTREPREGINAEHYLPSARCALLPPESGGNKTTPAWLFLLLLLAIAAFIVYVSPPGALATGFWQVLD